MPGGTVAGSEHEIKGVWLVTAKSWVLSRRGPGALQAIAEHLPSESRHAILEPLPSEWYPEAVLQQALAGMRAELAGGSDAQFLRLMRECTELGVSKFFRVLLRLSTPRFVLAKVPSMWSHIRRGPGHVSVEASAAGTTLHYRQFPYFADANYRLLTQGSLEGLMHLSTRQRPRVHLAAHGDDWLDVHVD